MEKYRIEEQVRDGVTWFFAYKWDGDYWSNIMGCASRSLEGCREHLRNYKQRPPNKTIGYHEE